MDASLNKRTTRRAFIKKAGLASAGVALGGLYPLADAAQDSKSARSPSGKPIPLRTLGKTGVKVSLLGLGGAHAGRPRTAEEAIRIIHEAIDSGVTFMDNAYDYNGGRSEELMGEAIKDRRGKVFLMTKVCVHATGGKAKDAMRQLETQLKRLQTDHLDLWQIHEVVTFGQADMYFVPGGAIEALDKAKEQGKVRFVGFTGHKDPRVHLRMLSHGYPFDTCQLPLNCFDATYNSFEKGVLPELKKQGIAALGMKALAGNGAPVDDGAVTARELLHYAMSLPVATVISGMDSLETLRQNVKIAQDWKQMTPGEMDALRKKVSADAASGRYEYYKR